MEDGAFFQRIVGMRRGLDNDGRGFTYPRAARPATEVVLHDGTNVGKHQADDHGIDSSASFFATVLDGHRAAIDGRHYSSVAHEEMADVLRAGGVRFGEEPQVEKAPSRPLGAAVFDLGIGALPDTRSDTKDNETPKVAPGDAGLPGLVTSMVGPRTMGGSVGPEVDANNKYRALMETIAGPNTPTVDGSGVVDDFSVSGHTLGGAAPSMTGYQVLLDDRRRERELDLISVIDVLIDDSKLIHTQPHDVNARCVVRAARALIDQVGVDNVFRLQLYPGAHVNERGELEGYVLLLRDSAPAVPVVDACPRLGAGVAVYDQISAPAFLVDGCNWNLSMANDMLHKVVSNGELVVDCSTDKQRRGESVYARALRAWYERNPAASAALANVSFASCDTPLPTDADDGFIFAPFAKPTLAERESSVMLARERIDGYDRPLIICDNYADHMTTVLRSMVHVAKETQPIGDGSSVDDPPHVAPTMSIGSLVDSPVYRLAVEHGHVARTSVIAAVLEGISEVMPQETGPEDDRIVKWKLTFSGQYDDGAVSYGPSLRIAHSPRYEVLHTHIRRLQPDEWDNIREHYLAQPVKFASIGHLVPAANEYGNYVAIFNGVSDPTTNTGRIKAPTVIVNNGHATGYTFVQRMAAKTGAFGNNGDLPMLVTPALGVSAYPIHTVDPLKAIKQLPDWLQRSAHNKVRCAGYQHSGNTMPITLGVNTTRVLPCEELALQVAKTKFRESFYMNNVDVHHVEAVASYVSSLHLSAMSFRARVSLAHMIDIPTITLDMYRDERAVREFLASLPSLLPVLTVAELGEFGLSTGSLVTVPANGAGSSNPVIAVRTKLADRLLSQRGRLMLGGAQR